MIQAVSNDRTGTTVQAPGGIRMNLNYRTVEIRVDPAPTSSPDITETPIPRDPALFPHTVHAMGFAFRLSILSKPPHNLPTNPDPFTAYIDFNALDRDLTIRPPRPGDRIQPLGMIHKKKLSDFFIDARIDKSERGAIPLLLCGDEVVWIVGHRIAHPARVRPATRRILRIHAKIKVRK